jgi:uncharacterized glyoxalase superfamily protein PhnB
VPVFTRVKVHRDFHVEVARALYSLPAQWIGQHLDARADSELVKLFHAGLYRAGGMVVALWERAALGVDSCVEDNGGWGGVTLAHNVATRQEVDGAIDQAERAGATIGRRGAATFWGGYSGVFLDQSCRPSLMCRVASGLVITYLLGAPGSGKTALLPHLRTLMPDRVILDWDTFMEPAGRLAGVPISESPSTWSSYESLVRLVVESIQPVPVLLMGVCTPAQLADWPQGRWMLLDCSDEERRLRLAARGNPEETEHGLRDAAEYRRLGLRSLDSTHLPLAVLAREIESSLASM